VSVTTYVEKLRYSRR